MSELTIEAGALEAQATPPLRTYTVKLPLFEGPLDLLLHLIEKQQLDITVISLAKVADQFVSYLEAMREVQPEVIVDFLVVAARLLLIKSRWLLPKPPVDDEEDEEDPGEVLARRLREYKRFKRASGFLKERESGRLHSFVRVAPPPQLETRLDTEQLSLDELLAALQRLLIVEPELQPVSPIVSRRKVTVREKIELIQELVKGGEPVPFHRLIGDARSRIEVVVSLWAVLELIKRGHLRARQPQLFGEILLVESPQMSEN